MVDQLYLSLWYPNFRLDALPGALEKVMEQFVAVGGSARVSAATAYPISWNETPAWQRVYRAETEDEDASPRAAIAAAMENAHDDDAWEFELVWELWVPEAGGETGLDTMWRQEPRGVRVVGFGPQFDEGAYETNGHIRVDFGLDTPFLYEDLDLDEDAVQRVKENVARLVEFTHLVQKNGGIATRLLWSESGESLARKLIERLQQVN
ncbi:MAG TPA: hypothetical protein VHX37_09235 [Acidobacteriaceae bacterium]|jgi:hypothetical protein|nr:hypothetical protein [Acidobacteriaceae bacterium]